MSRPQPCRLGPRVAAQDSVRFPGGRLELGCGFRAGGYARATGKPGVLITSTGPGAADSVGALGEAYFPGSPVLELTTTVEQEFTGSGELSTHEHKPQLGMLEAVPARNAMINVVEAIPASTPAAARPTPPTRKALPGQAGVHRWNTGNPPVAHHWAGQTRCRVPEHPAQRRLVVPGRAGPEDERRTEPKAQGTPVCRGTAWRRACGPGISANVYEPLR